MTWGVSSYSATPSANTNVNGTNIGEGCNASGINDAIRQIMADIAAWFATVPTVFVSSVAGRTGAVTLANTDISGLGTAAVQNHTVSTSGPSGGSDGDTWDVVAT